MCGESGPSAAYDGGRVRRTCRKQNYSACEYNKDRQTPQTDGKCADFDRTWSSFLSIRDFWPHHAPIHHPTRAVNRKPTAAMIGLRSWTHRRCDAKRAEWTAREHTYGAGDEHNFTHRGNAHGVGWTARENIHHAAVRARGSAPPTLLGTAERGTATHDEDTPTLGQEISPLYSPNATPYLCILSSFSKGDRPSVIHRRGVIAQPIARVKRRPKWHLTSGCGVIIIHHLCTAAYTAVPVSIARPRRLY